MGDRWYKHKCFEGEEGSRSEGWEEGFEGEDDIGRKGRKRKGENVRENSPVKKNVHMTQKKRNYWK